MNVGDAVADRRSVRAFLDRPVDPAILRAAVLGAGAAPSGGNLQPWHIFVLTGEALSRFKCDIATRIAENLETDELDYAIYPVDLPSLYRRRRSEVADALYGSIGVCREDRAARRRWTLRNFDFFGAPVGLFCFVDRRMGPPQWSDLGMYLQSLMLLLREAGLDSCAQEAWSLYGRTVSRLLSVPHDLVLFCGMAIGHADPEAPVNQFRARRAPAGEIATFLADAGERRA